MKTALITTTINVPTVLELYRQHGPDVAFFVAGDQKSPHDEIEELAKRVGGYFRYLEPRAQTQWKCSELIGWNCVQRRNVALLEAIRWGAEIIVSIDDDNIPLDKGYFIDICQYIGGYPYSYRSQHGVCFSGPKISSPAGWFDIGTLLDPIAPHRGFPHDVDSKTVISHVVDAKVGVAAGICLGDPDISAVTRIARAPVVHRVSNLLNSGIVVDPSTHTVFNSQNTAFIRELAPAFFMLPGVGRYDDIYASLIMQRVMRERGLHVHFGKPFVWQQRNHHNLVNDLRGEIDGMANIVRFSELLDGISMEQGASVTEHVAQCWMELHDTVPPGWSMQTIEAALAFLEDMETVL